VALCGLAVVRIGRVTPFWSAVILAGVLVCAFGLYWAYNM
jgi:hypothetical protein